MHEFEWYQGDLQKLTEETLKRIKTWQKNTCGRATFLETLQAAKVFQWFPFIKKQINSSRKFFQTYSEVCLFL